jgi:hypothetical protein
MAQVNVENRLSPPPVHHPIASDGGTRSPPCPLSNGVHNHSLTPVYRVVAVGAGERGSLEGMEAMQTPKRRDTVTPSGRGVVHRGYPDPPERCGLVRAIPE